MQIISKNYGYVVLCYYKNITIASGVFFHFGEKGLLKFGASDRKYHYLKANNLVMWEAIKWLSLNGFKSFSFGRTEPNNNGLIHYKDGWGTEKSIIHYYKYDIKNEAFIKSHYQIPSLINYIFSRTPIPILKLIGSKIYRYMG